MTAATPGEATQPGPADPVQRFIRTGNFGG